jgi:hypothetical protein
MAIKATETVRNITQELRHGWRYFGKDNQVGARIPVPGQISVMPNHEKDFSMPGAIFALPDDGESKWEGEVAGIKLRIYSVREEKK